MITDDDKRRYLAFALGLTKDLNSADIHPDTPLWHYTTGTSLISIFESKSFFSTQLSCLNDSTELRYASEHFRKALQIRRTSITSTGLASQLLDGAIEYFVENTDLPIQVVVPHFVTCFTLKRDDLSQWRAYGNGENGYAIGFKSRYLWNAKDWALVRINYDDALHAVLALRAVDAMIQFFEEGVKKYAPTNLVTFGEEFFGAWDSAIVLLAPLIKNRAFKDEEECRIVKTCFPADTKELKFIQKATMMSRHLPLQPPAGNAFDPYRLPIDEVMVGPCRHPQISQMTVDELLQQKGYPTGMVSISKIPYQST
jgi:hypothetical protein